MIKKLTIKDIEKFDDKLKLQISAYGRASTACELLDKLVKKYNGKKVKLTKFLKVSTSMVAYQMLIVNYIINLLGTNNRTDKISFYKNQKYKNTIDDFIQNNQENYNTLSNQRKKFYAHIDEKMEINPEIDLDFAVKCLQFIKSILDEITRQN